MQQPYRPIPKIGPSKDELEAERLAVDAIRRHRDAEGFAERLGRACVVVVAVLGTLYVLSAFASHNPRGGILRLFGLMIFAGSLQGATIFKRGRTQVTYLGPIDQTPRDYSAPFAEAPSPVEHAEPAEPAEPDAITRWTD